MTDVFLVTKFKYSSIFNAFELISHDCGRQAGHLNYAIPLSWEKEAINIDFKLRQLEKDSKEAFETFCIGEKGKAEEIAQLRNMNDANDLLQRFFEEFR
jgi:hypothetical protein